MQISENLRATGANAGDNLIGSHSFGGPKLPLPLAFIATSCHYPYASLIYDRISNDDA
jgi:hypothetical protein